MFKFGKSFRADHKASISIEFAIVFPFLAILFLFVIELSRIMFIGSALDLMTTEFTKKTAISEIQEMSYQAKLDQIIEEELPLWPYLTSSDDFDITVTYCNSIQQIIDEACETSIEPESQIILFKLKYQYYAIFSELFERMLDSSLTKKAIAYREFYL